MQQHQEKYLADPQLAFRQIYFNPDKRGKSIAADARQALARLTTGSAPEAIGDPTLLQGKVPLAALGEIRKEFGEEFARNLLALKSGGWAGPIRSGFGLHLVFVSQRADGQIPELSAIRATVQRDWTVERQQERKDAAYAKLRARYAVTVEQPQGLAVSAETKVTTQ
jgi:parvulin-like peptidyl-prolyl isomerase